jgi:SAM-dependent methyltransferase
MSDESQPHAPRNPWLDIPLEDYVGHMSSPNVGQRVVLNRLLADVLRVARPASVFIAGASSGNGIEHLDSAVSRRIVCVDINGTYLDALRAAFDNPAVTLETVCGDIAACRLPSQMFELVHAALVLEYVDWKVVLPRLAQLIGVGGMLSVVLQRPSAVTPAVTSSPFASLRTLEAIFNFVDPDELIAAASSLGLTVHSRRTEALPSAKAFEVLQFTQGKLTPLE